jgi:hypothetical protein
MQGIIIPLYRGFGKLVSKSGQRGYLLPDLDLMGISTQISGLSWFIQNSCNLKVGQSIWPGQDPYLYDADSWFSLVQLHSMS